MAMKVIKCPDCGHELARVILGGGTNQTKSWLRLSFPYHQRCSYWQRQSRACITKNKNVQGSRNAALHIFVK